CLHPPNRRVSATRFRLRMLGARSSFHRSAGGMDLRPSDALCRRLRVHFASSLSPDRQVSAERLRQAVTTQPVGAIVMGADYRGLGIVRSLGRRGIPVWVLKRDNQLLAAFSRYARRSFAWRGTDEAERVRFLLRLASSQGLKGWVLFPTDDEAVLLVARHHRVLAEHFRLTTPSWDQLRWAVEIGRASCRER